MAYTHATGRRFLAPGIFVLVVALLAVVSTLPGATPAAASSTDIGNAVTDRAEADTATDFIMVDTTNPASAAGTIVAVDFYAEAAGTVRVLVVDTTKKVTYVSAPIVVAAPGAVRHVVPSPLAVSVGDTLGFYSPGLGVISLDLGVGGNAYYELATGVPAVADTIVPTGTTQRTYSIHANMVCTTDCYADSVNGDDAGGSGQAADPVETIQKAVDLVQTGGTVHAAAGTYVENVIVPKPLTLEGAGNTQTIIKPALLGPNPPACGSLCAGASSVILVRAQNVVIRSLQVDGDNPALAGINVGGANVDARNGIITDHLTNPNTTGFEVSTVIVRNIFLRGIYASTTTGTFSIHDNSVYNVQGDPASIGIFNFGQSGLFANNYVQGANDGIAANWSKGTQFLDNHVVASGSGVHTDNNGGSGGVGDTLDGNIVEDCTPGGYGVWVFAPFVPVTVTENTVTNCEVGLGAFGRNNPAGSATFERNTVDAEGLVPSTGAYVSTTLFFWEADGVNATFRNNFIHNAEDGFTVESLVGDSLFRVAEENSFEGNSNSAFSFTGPGSFTADLNDNWWDSASGPTHASNAGGGGEALLYPAATAATYDPWLCYGTDTAPATPGFQPDPTICPGADTSAPRLRVFAKEVVSGQIIENNGWANEAYDIWAVCEDVPGSPGPHTGLIPGFSPNPWNVLGTTTGYASVTVVEDCVDQAGNGGEFSVPFSIQYDTTPPAMNVSAKKQFTNTVVPSGDWSDKNLNVYFSCSETPGVGASGLANGSLGTQTSTVSSNTTGQVVEANILDCTDIAGNTLSPEPTYLARIDKIKPTKVITLSPNVPFMGWSNQDVAWTKSCVDGGAVASGFGDTSFAGSGSFTTNGTHTVTNTGNCVDLAGNVANSVATRTVRIDKTAPVCTATASPSSLSANNALASININVASSDSGGSGIAASTRKLLSVSGPNVGPGDYIGWSVGSNDTSGQVRRYAAHTYNFLYEIKDNAGNGTTCTATVTIP